MSRNRSIKVSKLDVSAIVQGTFPSYRGRKFFLEADEKVTLRDLNWSGGSRTSWATCTLDGEPIGNADRFARMHPADNTAEGATVPIPSGAVLVEHVVFCGKDLGLRIHVNPADIARVLPSAAPAF